MSHPLPYDEFRFDRNVKLEDILNVPDDSDIGFFPEFDLKYPHNIKEKNFPICPEKRKVNLDDFTQYMNENNPNTYTQNGKLISDCIDKRNYLSHYWMLKFYVRHGMVVNKNHEKISFRQNVWLEKYTNFNTQKRNKAKSDFEKDFHKLLNNAFYGKTMENVLNRKKK